MRWYAIREDGREDDEYGPALSHTVNVRPGRHGWENDSGVDGYGLSWAQAQDIETQSIIVEDLRRLVRNGADEFAIAALVRERCK